VQGRIRAAGLAVVIALIAAAPAAADTFEVTTFNDGTGACPAATAACTLRTALTAAAGTSGSDVIHVPAGTYALNPQFGALNVNTNGVTIQGDGADKTFIEGNASSRVFSIAVEPKVVAMTKLTVRNGTATGTDAMGGNILVNAGAVLVLDHVRVTGGTASRGGGIASQRGGLSITSSLIDHNTATTGTADGGGILSYGAGSGGAGAAALQMTDSTIAFNTAGIGGGLAARDNSANSTRLERVTVARNTALSSNPGGIYTNDAESMTVHATIVADNTGVLPNGAAAVPTPSNCALGALTDSGANVEYPGTDCGFGLATDRRQDPLLADALQDDGGPVPVLPIVPGSPAIDLSTDSCPGTAPILDQRDIARPQGAACDAGAYEAIPAAPPPPPTVTPTPTPAPAPTPVPQKSVTGQVVDGKVLVRKPGSKTFVPLDPTQPIPLGSTIDTTDGEVKIAALLKKGAKTETATFFDGIFKITQTKKTTDLTLNEQLASCGKGSARAAAKKPKTRKLWGSGSGSFRTRGQYSSATVRGTEWLVQDSCEGTLTRVKHGVVTVHDDVRRKTIILRAGKKYLARPKKR
jgi:hypothetical protein